MPFDYDNTDGPCDCDACRSETEELAGEASDGQDESEGTLLGRMSISEDDMKTISNALRVASITFAERVLDASNPAHKDDANLVDRMVGFVLNEKLLDHADRCVALYDMIEDQLGIAE